MTHIPPNKNALDAFTRDLASPVFESRESYLDFCNSSIQMYAKAGVRPPETPYFSKHLERIQTNTGTIIKTPWGGVDIEKHKHPSVEKYLVVEAGRFLAYEKHEQKVETLHVKEGHGVLVFRPDGSSALKAEVLTPGYTRTLKPNHEHTIIALSNLLVFEKSTDPKGMDQDLIFIYEP